MSRILGESTASGGANGANGALTPVVRSAPSAGHVVTTIARREIGLAARRGLVRILFLGSLLPPIVLAVILLVQIFAEQTFGTNLGWDPLLRFLQAQAIPVALLSLALGTPLVARDRAEDVIFLYGVRPVQPWQYVLGKLLAVAAPAAALMLFPGIVIAFLRMSVVGDLSAAQGAAMVSKVALAALLVGAGYAGVAVGPSAAVKRARTALLLSIGAFTLPDLAARLISLRDPAPIGPSTAIRALLASLFGQGDASDGLIGAVALITYAVAGFLVARARVGREMTP